MSVDTGAQERRGGLSGRVVVVTGASRGLGRGIAERFAREGSRVVVNARRAEAADQVVQTIRDAGGTAIGVIADVAVRADVNRLFDEVMTAYGQVDVLVNNAAFVGPNRHFFETTDQQFNDYLSNNVSSVFYCSERAGRIMARQRRGAIINLCSIVSARPSRLMVAYTTTKAAIDGFTRALAIDLAPFGVRVNGIAPGIVWSPERFASATPAEVRSREVLLPLGRIGRPEDIGAACAYLASDDADYVVGQIWNFDGGSTVPARPMSMEFVQFDPDSIQL